MNKERIDKERIDNIDIVKSKCSVCKRSELCISSVCCKCSGLCVCCDYKKTSPELCSCINFCNLTPEERANKHKNR